MHFGPPGHFCIRFGYAKISPYCFAWGTLLHSTVLLCISVPPDTFAWGDRNAYDTGCFLLCEKSYKMGVTGIELWIKIKFCRTKCSANEQQMARIFTSSYYLRTGIIQAVSISCYPRDVTINSITLHNVFSINFLG